ncbi:hypothetical protein Taro_002119 [Colocasia esculenta]|uniref:Uncharacterized protein n=1 Tax=Colocasia esculenta TaxID=4460 RepID=A0A843TJU5_COLES|nr:hypothetical protein [Colocasia esculenta]
MDPLYQVNSTDSTGETCLRDFAQRLDFSFFLRLVFLTLLKGPGPDPGAIDHGICHLDLAYHCGLLAKEISVSLPLRFAG